MLAVEYWDSNTIATIAFVARIATIDISYCSITIIEYVLVEATWWKIQITWLESLIVQSQKGFSGS